MSEMVHRVRGTSSCIYHCDPDCDLIDDSCQYTHYRIEIARAWDSLRPCKECGGDSA
jgi:hypothetical protein